MEFFKRLNPVYFFLLLFCYLFVVSCQKEEVSSSIESEIQKQKIPELSAKVFHGDSIIEADKFINIQLKSFNKNINRSQAIFSSKYNISIDTSKIQIIQTLSYKSYTLYVKRENSDPKFLENYVITHFNNGGYYQYLIQYPIIEEDDKITYDIGNASIQIIDDPQLLFKSGEQTCTTVIEYKEEVCVEYDCKGDAHHHYGDTNCEYLDDPNKVNMRASKECTEAGWIETNSCSSGGTTTPSTPTTDPPNDGSNNTPNPDDAEEPIDEEIVIPLGSTIYDEVDKCINNPFHSSSLLGIKDETTIDRSIIDNLEKTQLLSIKQYLDDNSCSEEAQGFAIEAANTTDSGGNFNIFTKVIFYKSFTSNTRLNQIYKSMGAGQVFESYLQKFIPDGSVANLRFGYDVNFGKRLEIPKGAMAVTTPAKNYVIDIIFNGDDNTKGSINDLPDLTIALSFIHEIIHAEMYRKLLSCAKQPQINYKNMSDEEWRKFIDNLRKYHGIYDYFLRYKYYKVDGVLIPIEGPTDEQHQHMAESYRNTIIAAISEYDNYQHDDSFYEALSWQGLMGTGDYDSNTGLFENSTQAWKLINEDPNLSNDQERLNIINIILNFQK